MSKKKESQVGIGQYLNDFSNVAFLSWCMYKISQTLIFIEI